MVASFSQYLPLSDLWKIVLVCLGVAVVAPASVSVAIAGLDRRDKAQAAHRGTLVADALIVVGVAVLLALIAGGIYILDKR